MLLCPFHFEVVHLSFDVVLMLGVRVAQSAFLGALLFVQFSEFLAVTVIELVQILALLFRGSLKILAERLHLLQILFSCHIFCF